MSMLECDGCGLIPGVTGCVCPKKELNIMADQLDTLKPCPFCGGDAGTSAGENTFFAHCLNGNCLAAVGENYDRNAMPEHYFTTENDAITAWNTRAEQVGVPTVQAGDNPHFAYDLPPLPASSQFVNGYSQTQMWEYARLALAAGPKGLSMLKAGPDGQSVRFDEVTGEALPDVCSPLEMIANIAEGSTTANSLPHIAKIARKAINAAPSQPVAVPSVPDDWYKFVENIATPYSEPVNSMVAYRGRDDRVSHMQDLRATAHALLTTANAGKDAK